MEYIKDYTEQYDDYEVRKERYSKKIPAFDDSYEEEEDGSEYGCIND